MYTQSDIYDNQEVKLESKLYNAPLMQKPTCSHISPMGLLMQPLTIWAPLPTVTPRDVSSHTRPPIRSLASRTITWKRGKQLTQIFLLPIIKRHTFEKTPIQFLYFILTVPDLTPESNNYNHYLKEISNQQYKHSIYKVYIQVYFNPNKYFYTFREFQSPPQPKSESNWALILMLGFSLFYSVFHSMRQRQLLWTANKLHA